MKRTIRNITILFFPFFFMVFVNEMARTEIKGKSHTYLEVNSINSAQKIKNKCSWACHDNTSFCKENHVKLLKNHFNKTDLIYFGIINTLKNTGNYNWANVLILVAFIPFLIWFLFVKSLDIQTQINTLKQR